MQIQSRLPNVPAALLEKCLGRWAHNHISQFASDLSDARALWRKHRALVEAPDFPQFLRTYYVDEFGYEPDQEFPAPEIDVLGCVEANGLTPEVREQLLPEAMASAQRKMQMELAGQEVVEVDRDLGRCQLPMVDPAALKDFDAAVAIAREHVDDQALRAVTLTLEAHIAFGRREGFVRRQSTPRASMLFFIPAIFSASAARVPSSRRRFLSAFWS
jgi:hypothetical protein